MNSKRHDKLCHASSTRNDSVTTAISVSFLVQTGDLFVFRSVRHLQYTAAAHTAIREQKRILVATPVVLMRFKVFNPIEFWAIVVSIAGPIKAAKATEVRLWANRLSIVCCFSASRFDYLWTKAGPVFAKVGIVRRARFAAGRANAPRTIPSMNVLVSCLTYPRLMAPSAIVSASQHLVQRHHSFQHTNLRELQRHPCCETLLLRARASFLSQKKENQASAASLTD